MGCIIDFVFFVLRGIETLRKETWRYVEEKELKRREEVNGRRSKKRELFWNLDLVSGVCNDDDDVCILPFSLLILLFFLNFFFIKKSALYLNHFYLLVTENYISECLSA